MLIFHFCLGMMSPLPLTLQAEAEELYCINTSQNSKAICVKEVILSNK